MKFEPTEIFREYHDGVRVKSALGDRGLYEQSAINERFYNGDQWYGAKCGNDRPLVRHNVIRRIGEFKIAQILGSPIAVRFSADGIQDIQPDRRGIQRRKHALASGAEQFGADRTEDEVNLIMSALSDYRNVTAERVALNDLCGRMLKNAYVSGTGVLYTYWDDTLRTGLYADDAHSTPIIGDIACEVLRIENVYFGDPYGDSVEDQPYIIIASRQNADTVRREALRYGATPHILRELAGDEDGKILVLTRLYKEYEKNGTCTVRCIKVTERAVVRPAFDTRLRMYPLTVFNWENRAGSVYGDSEVTYLVPNQIAINRMITAKVWATMTMGMPMMVVNGDTVTENITNDPGQIIRIYGSNEDVAGAVRYVSPPDFSIGLDQSVNTLIENTLTQSGANAAVRGDDKAENATAIITLRNTATLPMQLMRSRFYDAVERLSRIWADFWITQYGTRKIRIEDESGTWYLPFSAPRYRDLLISARVDVGNDTVYGTQESVQVLNDLFDKGMIDRRQYLKRLPKGLVSDVDGLLEEEPQEKEEESS